MKPSRFNEVIDQIGAEEVNVDAARIGFRVSIITVHGLNTEGDWQTQLHEALDDQLIRIKTIHTRYGKTLPALMPKGAANRAENIFVERYTTLLRLRIPILAVGHSFGTFVVGQALQHQPDIQLDRIILSASILPRDFPWSDFTQRRVGRVLNEHCRIDYVVMSSLFWRLWPFGLKTGLSGCNGFSNTCGGKVANIAYKHTGHTRLPRPLHMREAWIPFLLRGELPQGG